LKCKHKVEATIKGIMSNMSKDRGEEAAKGTTGVVVDTPITMTTTMEKKPMGRAVGKGNNITIKSNTRPRKRR